MTVIGVIEPVPYTQPPVALRILADEIEHGEHGEVVTLGIVLVSEDEVELFGMGPESRRNDLAFAFQAALNRIHEF